MNILYISKLSGNRWTGPNNSVPAQVAAQARIDNVLWYNLAEPPRPDWLELDYYCDLRMYPDKTLKALPSPFDRPDLVVFQGCYNFPFSKIVFDTWLNSTPYVIIPRCEFTDDAQSQKWLKKRVANWLFFNRFVRKARAVHYLTENERKESQRFCGTRGFVIPNGVPSLCQSYKERRSVGGIRGVYIGRIDVFHKGLDLLVDACGLAAAELRAQCCTIRLYGPDCNGSVAELNNRIRELNIEDIISIRGPVFDKEKSDLLEMADFFIMTSRFEGHPMGLIEALAYGLPCIVSQGTNMLDDITRVGAGWGGDGSSESISSCIKDLLMEKNDLPNRARQAAHLAKDYKWDGIALRSKDVYTSLLNIL